MVGLMVSSSNDRLAGSARLTRAQQNGLAARLRVVEQELLLMETLPFPPARGLDDWP
jgi:hypothetical protein